MAYCSHCGQKNDDSAQFCLKCGRSLHTVEQTHMKDDDCVCEGDNRNPLVPIFWGIAVILIGLWILYQFALPKELFPSWFGDISFCSLIFLIIAISIILTGLRMLTKKK